MSNMSKKVQFIIAALVMLTAAIAMAAGTAQARWHHGFHAAFLGPRWDWSFPQLGIYDNGPYGYYYAPRRCGWVRVRVHRHHHWVLRRAWRCW